MQISDFLWKLITDLHKRDNIQTIEKPVRPVESSALAKAPNSMETLIIMPYRDRLNRWLVVRSLPNMQRIIVARCRNRSDADGYLHILRRLIPDGTFIVVFDGDTDSGEV